MPRFQKLDGALPYLYCLFALISALVVVLRLPPLMGADEPNHLKRANLLDRGTVFGQRVQVGTAVSSGGVEEDSLDSVEAIFAPMEFHPEVKNGQLDLQRASLIQWSETASDQSFENTAVYPPTFYVPSAIGIEIGKLSDQSIVASLKLARMFNALACIMVGFFALRVAGRASPYLFTLLLLPMTVALTATVTQDGLLIVTSVLGSAFMIRPLRKHRSMKRSELYGATICLALVGMAKPPYVLLALVLLLVRAEKPLWNKVAVGSAMGTALLWHLLMAVFVQTPLKRAGVVLDPGAQFAYLLHHPIAFASVLFQTILHSGAELAAEFAGVLGWLDTPLPKFYYGIAFLVLASAVALIWSIGRTKEIRRCTWALFVLTATSLAIFLGLYLAYTPVGAPLVEGVQGRYFLPIAAFLPIALIGTREIKVTLARKAAWGLVLLLPVIGLFVIEQALTKRFY